MKFFLLPVENWGREFESKLYLIECISKYLDDDAVLLVAPKRVVNLLMLYGVKNAGILHKSIQQHHVALIDKVVSRGCSYFFLEEESIHRNISLDARFGRDVPSVTKVFSTTDEDYQSLLKKFSSSVIEKTGTPRFDFLFFEHPMHRSQSLKIKQEYGDFYLFSSNFSFVFPPEDHKLANLDSEGIWKNKSEKEALYKYIEEHKARALKVCEWLKVEAENRKIVYRPHPLESIELVREFFKDSNVLVVREGSIMPWLKSCSGLWHSGCTVAIEFALTGRQPEFLLPLDQEVSGLPYQVSIIRNSLSSFKPESAASYPRKAELLAETFGADTSSLCGKSTALVAQSMVSNTVSASRYNIVLWLVLAWCLDFWFRRKVSRSHKEKTRLINNPLSISKLWERKFDKKSCNIKSSSLGRYSVLYKIKK